VHGRRHPLASHVEKLIAQLLVLDQSRKPHALAGVAYAFLIDGGHNGLQRPIADRGHIATFGNKVPLGSDLCPAKMTFSQ